MVLKNGKGFAPKKVYNTVPKRCKRKRVSFQDDEANKAYREYKMKRSTTVSMFERHSLQYSLSFL